jgi:hypothetical protein
MKYRYTEIREDANARIAAKLYGIRRLARASGVDPGPISRAISGKQVLGAKSYAKVLEGIKKLEQCLKP